MTLVQTEPKKIYIWVDAQVVTTPGIYHNPNAGLISLSSDGSNWLTIADKNLGATSTDVSSTNSHGYFYQWGNCYGFPASGSISDFGNPVNAGTYGPNNYYSSNLWIRQGQWDTSHNLNLRGGTTGTFEAEKGPCDTGYHIPSTTELTNLYNLGISMGAWTSSGGTNMMTYLKIPTQGKRSYSTGNIVWTSYGMLRACNSISYNHYGIRIESSSITVPDQDQDGEGTGRPIRPFKNVAVQPDDSRTVLYQ